MCICLGGEESSPSTGDVIVLLTGDACFGIASDKEAGLTIFFMSYIGLISGLMKTVLASGTKRW